MRLHRKRRQQKKKKVGDFTLERLFLKVDTV